MTHEHIYTHLRLKKTQHINEVSINKYNQGKKSRYTVHL